MLRQNSGALGVDVICKRLKISRRTFYRDIRLLRNAGARVTYRADTGAYEAELFSSIIGESLSTREAAAVKAALQGARPRRGSDFECALESARHKMTEIIGEQFKDHAGAVDRLTNAFVGDQSDRS
ncbi:MAG: HTH domain-containing protein [Phycisphaerales bacterium]|nr:HTH domain-containing protein [Phycisphaerales bacterium]